MKGNKTTKEHFLIFKRECLKWINKYGLKAWDIKILHEDCKDSNNKAECSYDVVNRSAILRIGFDWGKDDINTYQLKRDAYHEVCELLLCNIRLLSKTRFLTEIEIDEEIHAIIRTLENVVFEGK